MQVDHGFKKSKDQIDNLSTATGVISQIDTVQSGIIHIISKASNVIARITDNPIVRSIHILASFFAGLAVIFTILRQSLALFYLTPQERSTWWDNKTASSKAAYVTKFILTMLLIPLVLTSFFVPVFAAAILLVACYVTSSARDVIDLIRKLPKLFNETRQLHNEKIEVSNKIAALLVSCKNNIQSLSFKEQQSLTHLKRKEQTLTLAIRQQRWATASRVVNSLFGGLFIIAAIVAVIVPPVGAIFLAVAAVTSIAVGVTMAAVNSRVNKQYQAVKLPEAQQVPKLEAGADPKLSQELDDTAKMDLLLNNMPVATTAKRLTKTQLQVLITHQKNGLNTFDHDVNATLEKLKASNNDRHLDQKIQALPQETHDILLKHYEKLTAKMEDDNSDGGKTETDTDSGGTAKRNDEHPEELKPS